VMMNERMILKEPKDNKENRKNQKTKGRWRRTKEE
jgi:hypothetical protein